VLSTDPKEAALLARQEQLEASSYTEGAERFKRRLAQAAKQEAATTVGGPKKLLREGMAAMENGIVATILAPAGKGKGKQHCAAKWCELVGPAVAAYLTLKAILDGIGQKKKLREIALFIAHGILDEIRYRRFQQTAPYLFEYKLKQFHTANYKHKKRSLDASMRFAEIEETDLHLPVSQCLRIGIKLIDICIEATGLVKLEGVREKRKGKERGQTLFLVPTATTSRWIQAHNREMEFWHPIVMPMVYPPKAWAAGKPGGYHFRLRHKFTLVRSPYQHALHQDIGYADLPVVYEALNAMQATAWRVNQQVLRTVLELQKLGGGVAGLPNSDPLPLPAKPLDIAHNEEARKAWRKLVAPIKEQNATRRREEVSTIKTLSAARMLRDDPKIYFPYSLDFRGRIYPLPVYLTPYEGDLARSLLTFAEGKPIDVDGARWLAIHGANCMGKTPEGGKVSKMTMEERREWIIKNSGRIVAAADNPTVDLWWTKADDPLQFLAFCFEWANLIRANDRGEVYTCSLPCGMDGTCNGLQHFSALFRDEAGARTVNMIAQDQPWDIYQVIADAVLDKLEHEKEPLALLWLGLHSRTGIINRKLTKRPTMTFGYGSKRFGFTEQLLDYLRGLEDYQDIRRHFTATKEDKPKVLTGAACSLMSRLIWEALNEIVVAAFDCMAWMQKATRGITKQNKAVSWTVPATGFKVYQDYHRFERRDVKTILAGRVIKPRVNFSTDVVNPIRQANAIAPNFIHSLDAAALMLTVVAGREAGIQHWSMIHDSYGTVPADCTKLARICREAFVRLYTERDVAAELHAELAGQWKEPDKCPAPPAKGDFDVSQVLQSTYFFA
jgi:DNA-directed RNA polymerase